MLFLSNCRLTPHCYQSNISKTRIQLHGTKCKVEVNEQLSPPFALWGSQRHTAGFFPPPSSPQITFLEKSSYKSLQFSYFPKDSDQKNNREWPKGKSQLLRLPVTKIFFQGQTHCTQFPYILGVFNDEPPQISGKKTFGVGRPIIS